ncbi:hypothetical protein B0J11DRAFT_167077 [Dendryphion nanum]|uniref:Zn(2)-C6 fungal-type domain-containing protein n=1 Tax=Dendryphion nanum TaxID=256645 RepID=A0A9P9IUA2_9PLEO|nr:hypothetical protein B0J11DRAFT_167077 [Dendryphion nanum]
MVGVPGRSKGCLTCRERRKRCDLQQPTCANCIRGRFVCGGYQREVIIVHVGIPGQGQSGRYRSRNPRPPRQSSQLVVPTTPSAADHRIKDLNRTALELGLFTAFWDLYYPKGTEKNVPTEVPIRDTIRWGHSIQSMIPGSSLTRSALLALTVSELGQSKQDENMVHRGMELYGTSLARLACELKTPSKITHTELAATCRLLALYEAGGNSDSPQNWLRHTEGLLKLIELQDPEIFSSPGNHEMFLEARYNALVIALTKRKANFISKPEWKTKPWNGRQKNTLDSIMDILVTMSEIIEDFDRALLDGTYNDNERNAIEEKCWNLKAQLRAWYQECVTVFTPLLSAEDADCLLEDIDGTPTEDLPDRLHKYSLASLYTIVLYWTANILLHDILGALPQSVAYTTLAEEGFLDFGTIDSTPFCTCIARSLRYFIGKDAGLSAAVSMAFPVHVVAESIALKARTNMNSYHYTDSREVEKILKDIKRAPGGKWIHTLVENPQFPLVTNRIIEETSG